MSESLIMEMTFSKEEELIQTQKQEREIKVVTGIKNLSQLKLTNMFPNSSSPKKTHCYNQQLINLLFPNQNNLFSRLM